MRRVIAGWICAAIALGLASIPAVVGAQDEAPALTSFDRYQVRPLGPPDGVEVVEVDGQQELILSRTSVLLEGVEFDEGVIEFDVAFEDKRGFGGLMWHATEAGDAEYFYIRQHKSGEPDAGQYTPMRAGLTSWQIFADANAIAPLAFAHEGWNRIKFVIVDDKADIYFNGSNEPVLHVSDLATDRGNGAVGFRTSGPNGKIRFANVIIRDLAPDEGIIGMPKETAPVPDGVITNWLVSERFAEKRVEGATLLPADLNRLDPVITLRVEPTGIVDLGRAGRPQDDADTVLVSTRILSDAEKSVRLRFGYSDRVRLFLNGRLVFDGVAGWRTRDFFFLGTIGFNDAVVLDLEEGENVLTAAVSETFGGWGFAGAIENDEGLTIRP